MLECPCGYYGDSHRTCRCTPVQIRGYQTRISGPLLDRIDIQIEVPSVRYRELAGEREGESSAAIRTRIGDARRRQKERFPEGDTFFNARMTNKQVRTWCPLDHESQGLVEMAIEKLGLSARAYTRILKVARTIADIEGSDDILASHVAEAIQYRNLDRSLI